MLKLELHKLVSNIRNSDADTGCTLLDREINPYLLAHVILPYLGGQDVDLKTLDYTAFSCDEIRTAQWEINEISNKARNVFRIMDYLRKTAPVVSQSKSFF